MHLSVAVTVAFVLTGDWRAALAIGLIEPFVQTFAYSFHEKAWEKTRSAASSAKSGNPTMSSNGIV